MPLAEDLHGEDLLQAQRRLRNQLFEGGGTPHAGVPGALDLAARMLVYLDDEAQCWQLMLDWVGVTLGADRIVGSAMPPIPCAIHAVRAARLAGSDGGAQVALVLRDGELPVGLVLCDWHAAPPGWTPPLLDAMQVVARTMLGPILAAATGVGAAAPSQVGERALTASLTPGELDVARLVVTGMSYKEIAQRLNRSFSTVDHRLRAIREKLGARSTARMVALLSEMLESPRLPAASPRGARTEAWMTA